MCPLSLQLQLQLGLELPVAGIQSGPVAAAFLAITVRLGRIHNIQLVIVSFVPGHHVRKINKNPIKIQKSFIITPKSLELVRQRERESEQAVILMFNKKVRKKSPRPAGHREIANLELEL